MAVAVKQRSETTTGNPLDRMPVICLAGLVYVLASLAIVFKLLPALWDQMCRGLGLSPDSFGSLTLLGLVMLGVATGLVVLGGRLLGPRTLPGVKAGIFCALVGFLLVLLLTRWFSLWVEYFVYHSTAGPTVGIVVVAVFFFGLLLLGARWFTRPSFEKAMVSFENQGWFSSTAYKKQQGLKVRRGTILGILILVGAGIYSMLAHNTLAQGPANWELNVPFSGKVTITKETEGDAAPYLEKMWPAGAGHLVIDRYALRDINEKVDPDRYVKIDKTGFTGDSKFKDGEIVPKSDYEAEEKEFAEDAGYTYDKDRKKYVKRVGDTVEEWKGYAVKPELAYGPVTYSTIPLLPAVKFTLPLLLLAAALWFAWRVVSLPVFADFLIATEAELNKVSWTTRRRLLQDTVVVLITVILLAGYLFAMDQIWGTILSWKPFGVIVISKQEAKGTEQKPW
jgi:preprotein translocase SecE subunit